jgi:hypothetical protein
LSELINDSIVNEDYFSNDLYAEAYGEEYKIKIRELKRCILDKETGEGKFLVLNTEASLGKSINTNKIIRIYNDDSFTNTYKKFLIVKRFKKDIEETASFLGEWMNTGDNINVLGITGDNWSDWKTDLDQLKDIQTLIISHQRYIDLCENKEYRDAFQYKRDILVIDEKVEFPVYTFSKKTYDDIHSYLPFGMENDLSEVCKPLKDMVSYFYNDQKTKNECIFCTPQIEIDKVREFEKKVLDNKDNIEYGKWNIIQDFIKSLYLLYETRCLYNGGRISTFNRDHKLWGLKNNIILDASGEIDYIYRLSDSNYIINRQMRVVDDKKINIHPILFNTSKSSIKEHRIDFFDAMSSMIKEKTKPDEKVLLICHKENSAPFKVKLVEQGFQDVAEGDDYHGENIAINWFGNVIGKNTYKDFNTCWILGKPNLPLEAYIIHYMQYSQTDTIGRKPMTIVKGKFTNKTFSSIQTGEIASQMYQAMKRIQRNAFPEGDIYIVLDDEQILYKIINDMKNPTVQKPIPVSFNMNKKTKAKEDKVDQIVGYLKNMNKGKYNKTDLCETLEIEKSNLSRYLNNVKVKNLEDTGILKIHRLYIDKKL